MRRSSSLPARVAAAALIALALAACGSSAATARRSTAVNEPAGARTAATPTSTAPAADCASTVADTLGQVGQRIYHVAGTGGDVAEAVHRVTSTAALASAINGGEVSAADSELRALALGQIVRIEIIRDGRVFASAGAGAAIAPVRGRVPGTGASFVLSVQSEANYLQVLEQVTGAQIELGDAAGRWLAGTIHAPAAPAAVPAGGSLSYAGTSYQVASFAGAAYPAGALRIALLVAFPEISCPSSTAQARVEALGHVGERIYREELSSADVTATLHLLERSSAFRDAVAEGNAAATRAAINGFFAEHIHVVRVRVTVGRRLLVDDGGPYVLAPVHGTLRLHGRVVGRFEMAIQDDAGYLKLAHLFTGAQVLMRVGGRQVQGTLNPGPATVPDRGPVDYAGRTYEAYSFNAEAFPSGALRISLLL